MLTVLILLPLSAAAANLQTATRSVSLGLPDTADWVAGADKPDSAMGDRVTTVGDVNGDGYEDLLVGAFGYRTVGRNDGRVDLFLGSASGLSATPAWTVKGGYDCHNAFCNIGRGIGAAGDVNGDGYDDVIVAANCWSNGQTDEGRAFVYYGSANGLAATPNWSVESNQAYAYLGWIAGTAGDVNGDGHDDLFTGAPQYDLAFTASPTTAIPPRQKRTVPTRWWSGRRSSLTARAASVTWPAIPWSITGIWMAMAATARVAPLPSAETRQASH